VQYFIFFQRLKAELLDRDRMIAEMRVQIGSNRVGWVFAYHITMFT